MGLLNSTNLTYVDQTVRLFVCPAGEEWSVKVKATTMSPNTGTSARLSIFVSMVEKNTPSAAECIEYAVPIPSGSPLETDVFPLSPGQSVFVRALDAISLNVHLFGIKI